MAKKRKETKEQSPGNPVIIKAIKGFIHLDGHDLTNIRIELDRLALFLIRDCGRQFSVSKMEKHLKGEMEKKLLGKVMNEKIMDSVCEYIDKLSIYLTKEMLDVKQGRNSKIPGSD